LRGAGVVDGAGNGLAASATDSWTVAVTQPIFTVYLPFIAAATPAGPPALPDLVGSISLSPTKTSFAAGEPVMITVSITNRGTAASSPAWADLFINPSSPPTGANQIWSERCELSPCFGMAWLIPALAPGERITLTSTASSFSPGHSIW